MMMETKGVGLEERDWFDLKKLETQKTKSKVGRGRKSD